MNALSSLPDSGASAKDASAQALRRALLEAVVDEAPIALALFDAAGRLLLDNREYRKFFAEQEPARLLDMAAPDWKKAATGAFSGFRAHEVCLEPPMRWFSCSLLPIAGDGGARGPCLLFAASDISILRQGQEKARQAALHALLLEEERAEVLRESLSAALYRLEVPLNVMRSAVSLPRNPDAAMPGTLATALAEGQSHLEELRQLIPLSSREAFTPVNLNEVLRDVLDVCTARMLRDGITVTWRPTAILPAILGRPLQLHALFKALVDNAIDALAQRGWKMRELRLSTRLSQEYVQVFIDDTGPGVPAELRLKVFEPFFTTRAHQGRQHLGTGLSRALQLACEHGGTLALAAAPGGGCRAFVELPVGKKEGIDE
ncbi:MAG: nitrogen fixation negative regulator NifL [Zoogloeaceae bacterium]|nr:nitrogen fixation negative regulator NifL [Zoogloeaceae bacterium]